MLRGTARECAAEFLGTFVLVVFGVAVVAQVVLSDKSHGQYLSINVGWGVAVMMGIFVAGGVTGAHLNPAVTLAAAVWQDFSWRKVLPYWAAQLVGAFVASAVPGGLVDQIVGTALLVGCIFAIADKRNLNATPVQLAFAVGLLVLLIGMTFGFNSGYAINPARDLGPRLFTFIAGWGSDVFRWGNHWWWVPIVGPLAGGVVGGWVYNVLIGNNHPPQE